jgi:hypothetical protein
LGKHTSQFTPASCMNGVEGIGLHARNASRYVNSVLKINRHLSTHRHAGMSCRFTTLVVLDKQASQVYQACRKASRQAVCQAFCQFGKSMQQVASPHVGIASRDINSLIQLNNQVYMNWQVGMSCRFSTSNICNRTGKCHRHFSEARRQAVRQAGLQSGKSVLRVSNASQHAQ